MLQYIQLNQLNSRLDAVHKDYQNAKPFKHLVLGACPILTPGPPCQKPLTCV